jgi:hypothetical protein
LFEIGKTFSLNNSYAISAELSYLHLNIKVNHTYIIQVHDPNFHFINGNPGTALSIFLTVDDSTSCVIYINAIYHELLDKKTQKCESSESYSFTACIKINISRLIQAAFNPVATQNINWLRNL